MKKKNSHHAKRPWSPTPADGLPDLVEQVEAGDYRCRTCGAFLGTPHTKGCARLLYPE